MSRFLIFILTACLLSACVAAPHHDEPVPPDPLVTMDFLHQPATFTIHDPRPRDGFSYITFPSPLPSGDASLDTVYLRWFAPLNVAANEKRPAVLVIHTLHPDLPVGLMLARGLASRGYHAFLLELPGYGRRIPDPQKYTGVTALEHGQQATAEARFARNIIEQVPGVDSEFIAIQGTSLGSFVATNAAALDDAFDLTFLYLAGGDGVDILTHGQKDAYHVKNSLAVYGYEGDKLRQLIEPIEPLRNAHRLDPQRAWLFSAKDDQVIPPKNAQLLADAIGLSPDHHIWLQGNHYTAFFILPAILDRMVTEMQHYKITTESAATQ